MRKAYLFIAAALIGMPAAVVAQSSANASVSVTATVWKGISITPNTGALDFGTVIAGQAGAPTISATGGSAAAFAVSGQGSAPISITWDASTNLPGPGATPLTFNPAVVGNQANSQTGTTTLSSGTHNATLTAGGAYYVWVGGNLSGLAGTTAPGSYSGTWNMSVAY